MTNEITDYPVSRTLEEAYGDGEARAQMRRIEAEHDAKSPFQREVEKLGQRECRHCGWLCVPNDAPAKTFYPLEPQAAKQQAEPGADERAACEASWNARYSCVSFEGFGAEYLRGWLDRAAQSGQRAGVADGWQLVPVEPTIEMLRAADRLPDSFSIGDEWKAMLAAAPTQQEGE